MANSEEDQERRKKALAFAAALESPSFGQSIDYSASPDDLVIASPLGYAFVQIHQAHVGPKSGFRLCERSLKALKPLLRKKPEIVMEWSRGWEHFRDDFEPKFLDALAMTKAACKPDTTYHRLALTTFNVYQVLTWDVVGKEVLYSEDLPALEARWQVFVQSLLDRPDQHWKQMHLSDLENTLGNEFGYDPEAD